MTLRQMLDGIDEDLVPSDQTMLEDLLWAFGACEDLEEMNAAMQARVYTMVPDSAHTPRCPLAATIRAARSCPHLRGVCARPGGKRIR